MAVETVSAPEFEEVPVTDLDFHFLYGGTQSFTLYEGDICTPDYEANTITVKLRTGPEHTIYVDKLAFRSRQNRMHKVPVKKVSRG